LTDTYLELSDDCDDIIKQKWSSKGVSRIRISDGVPDMSTLAELSFDANITGVRSENYDEFFKYLANEWKKDDADIPADVLKVINAQYSKRDLTSSDIQNILSTLGWTPHEGIDGKVYLIDSYVHSKISHSGGVATAKAFSEVKLGTLYLSNLSSSSAKSVAGTLIPEAVTD